MQTFGRYSICVVSYEVISIDLSTFDKFQSENIYIPPLLLWHTLLLGSVLSRSDARIANDYIIFLHKRCNLVSLEWNVLKSISVPYHYNSVATCNALTMINQSLTAPITYDSRNIYTVQACYNLVNILLPIVSYLRHITTHICVNIGWGSGFLPDGTKPLSGPIEKCQQVNKSEYG